MISKKLEMISDLATAAQLQIQQEFTDVDPIVGFIQSLRDAGYPADILTIDCIRSGKRISCLLHDDKPDVVGYQFADKEAEPSSDFTELALADLSTETFYTWMKSYFCSPTKPH